MTEAKSEVMKLLWRKEPLSADEIIMKLTHQMHWFDQTIRMFLNRLHKKEAIRFEKPGRNYLYYPLVTHDEYLKTGNRCFLDRFY
ncbi:BlaI/MecI/CopY family transcriptional regulator [Paenibacillus macquariensis]|uniref:BlaI/MecI/CopY family transcriptional regulator n=1 Tax=Paenibacillus macquariensis TaxID=948756 RepID=UPI0024534D6A|nr:BlaI/MecI/CopY family transcriptional regulator [Paenibacillus macquariensis]MEC0092148.1 BlaI/MecI/CopY family transcriptional regulator [Paenibacillus macquariensis]